jgi:hypothetical protein
MTTIKTAVNMITFMILNPMANLSPEIKALGAIKTDVPQRPTAHTLEMSCEDFLWIICTINGISHKGKITAAQNPIVFTKNDLLC